MANAGIESRPCSLVTTPAYLQSVVVTSDMATDTDRPPAEQSLELVPEGLFLKVGGAITVIAPLVFIGALLTGTEVANNSLDLFGHLLYIVVILILYHIFRDGGPTIRIAAVLGVVGMLLISINDFLALASLELATQAEAADQAAQSALAAVDETLLVLRSHLEIVGNALGWGVGGGLFALAMLRTRRLPRWLAVGGLLFAALMMVSLFEVMFTQGGVRESMVFFLGNMYGRLWLVVLGISLIRLDKDAIP